jgi:hypothetical protein
MNEEDDSNPHHRNTSSQGENNDRLTILFFSVAFIA